MSLTDPMPSHRGHMPPVTVKARFSVFLPSPFSTVIDPTARTDGTLKEKALDEPMCGLPRRLNSTRSIALASVAVPTVERELAPELLLNGRVRNGSNTWSFFIREPAISPDGMTAALITDGPNPLQGNVVLKLFDIGGQELSGPRPLQNQALGHQIPHGRPTGGSCSTSATPARGRVAPRRSSGTTRDRAVTGADDGGLLGTVLVSRQPVRGGDEDEQLRPASWCSMPPRARSFSA